MVGKVSMEEPGLLELEQGGGVDLLNTRGASQELAKSQGKDLRHQLQLLADPTLLPAAALHPHTRLLPLATRPARIPLELGQDTAHHPTLAAPVGQMQPMVHQVEVWAATPGGMHGAPILWLKNLLRLTEKMRRSEMRAFNPATVKDELVLLFLLLCLFLKYSPSVRDRPSVAMNKE